MSDDTLSLDTLPAEFLPMAERRDKEGRLIVSFAQFMAMDGAGSRLENFAIVMRNDPERGRPQAARGTCQAI